MNQPLPKMRLVATLMAAALLAAAPGPASAQDSTAAFRVLIDGTPAGSATIVTNLPMDAVVLHQNADTARPSTQVASAQQGNVVLTTEDPALTSAIQAWTNTNNSGSKNTVQRKTVEIDRMAGASPSKRYRLMGAWPTKVDVLGSMTVITIVYQRLEPVVP
jgi:hypothetical protein